MATILGGYWRLLCIIIFSMTNQKFSKQKLFAEILKENYDNNFRFEIVADNLMKHWGGLEGGGIHKEARFYF